MGLTLPGDALKARIARCRRQIAPRRANWASPRHNFTILPISSSASVPPPDYERIAIELVRALRGRRSCARLSQRFGYRSNVVLRWESGRSFPTAARFLRLHHALYPRRKNCFEAFFWRRPSWLVPERGIDAAAVVAFLRDLRGKTPLATLAAAARVSRHRVGRWLNGSAEPKLPEFLCLVDVATRRLPDWLATLVDPALLPSVARSWKQLCMARGAAYTQPWSHAVLRALELEGLPAGRARQVEWLAERLGISEPEVEVALGVLEQTEQVERTRRGVRVKRALVVDTAQDPAQGRVLKASWGRVALARLETGGPGSFGYSLFAVSKADLVKLRDLHLDYLRAMQQLIASSQPNECVGLYCAQLLDLGANENALAPAPRG
jgi:transcriptional regulator with XRE-family HTH domain